MAHSSKTEYRASPEEELAAIQHELSKVEADIEKLEIRQKYLLQRKEAVQDRIQFQKSEQVASRDWGGTDFPWSDKLESTLKNVFELPDFRPFQRSTMNAILSKEDTILLMPTGGGKSLCYQLPSLLVDGFILVVCPLVALMEDQILSLKKFNVPAYMLSQNTPKDEVKLAMMSITDKKAPMKLLYVTPERMAKSKTFMNKLQKAHEMGRLSCLAIDEVHCCSEWGHDFRPDYMYLNVLKEMFQGVPILGLTATATTKILVDVQKILHIQGCLVLKSTFNRPNLFYEVRPKPASQEVYLEELVDLLMHKYNGKSGIIYTTTIKDTEETANQLRKQGLRAAHYHAHMEPHMRSRAHNGWLAGKYQVVVATIAFGLGIDKPDVRFVIHQSICKSMESFYQESGRAGRDGLPADCIIFYRLADVFKVSITVFTQRTGLNNLYGVVEYCTDVGSCRRSLIASHFNEVWESSECKEMCDHCRSPYQINSVNIKEHCKSLYQIIAHASNRDTKLTNQKLMDAWFNKGASALRVPNAIPPSVSILKAEAIVAFLLINGFLREDFHYTAYSIISYIKEGPMLAEALNANSEITMDARGIKLQRKDLTNAQTNSTMSQIKKGQNSIGSSTFQTSSSVGTGNKSSKKNQEESSNSSLKDSNKTITLVGSSDSIVNISDSSDEEDPSPKRKRVKMYIDSDSDS